MVSANSTGATHTAQIAALSTHAASQTNVNAGVSSGLSTFTGAVNAASVTTATHTAQIATQEAFRVASRVNYSTNSGDAATVNGYTATQLLSQVGTVYYVWGSLAGPFTGVATKMAQLASPYAMGVWTSTVVGVTNLMPLGYVSINTNELPRFTVPGRETAHISIERDGNSQERTMRVCKSVYESNQVTLVSHVCGDAKAIPQGKNHLDFDLFETTETTITDARRYIVYSFTTVSGWDGGETIKVYSQDGELTYITTAGGAGVYASQSALDAHTTNTNNPHADTAAQVGAVATMGNFTRTGTLGGSNAVEQTDYPTLAQVQALTASKAVFYLTTNITTSVTNFIGDGTVVCLMSLTNPPISTIRSVTYASLNQYPIGWVFTNQIFSGTYEGGMSHLTIWCRENTAGSASHKPEFYFISVSGSNKYEYVETALSRDVPAGATYVQQDWDIAATSTNLPEPCYGAVRLKVTDISGTPVVDFQTGDGTISHLEIDVPLGVQLQPLYDLINTKATATPAGIAAAGGMTNGQPITAAQLPATVLTNNQADVTLTLIGGNAITNGAIPGPGCTDLGTAVNLVLSGATVAYVANPTGVYTVSVTKASSAGYVYTLTTFSSNSYTLASGLQLYGAHTIGATNEFVFVPQTNAVYKVRAQKVQ
jgi:hypothetical protein